MNILKIIEEEVFNYSNSIYADTEPNKLPSRVVVEHIIEYLFDNEKYNIVNGNIKTYDDFDGIKTKSIEIVGNRNGPYTDNKFNTYPHISFDLISYPNRYNIETVEITTYSNGFYKDRDKDKGKHLSLVKEFDGEFYKLLKKELKRNLRFDTSLDDLNNKPKLSSRKELSITPPEIQGSEDDIITMEESYLDYIEVLAKLDSNQSRKNEIINLINKIRKDNFKTKKRSYTIFNNYKKKVMK
jgi:hypothetical protein